MGEVAAPELAARVLEGRLRGLEVGLEQRAEGLDALVQGRHLLPRQLLLRVEVVRVERGGDVVQTLSLQRFFFVSNIF